MTKAPRLSIAALVLLAVASCAPSSSGPASLEGPDSSTRLDAVAHAAQTNDRSAIPGLINVLDDVDPAVRMLSAATLKKMTGLTFDYDPAAGRHRRLAAIERWKAWYKETGGAGGANALPATGGSGTANDDARRNTRDGLRGGGLGGESR